jgi:CheY-like chemotaxis protein
VNETILIVEDNLLNMELATDVLEAAGYRVRQAGTAEEGIAEAKSSAPALILMDVALPGMDGLTATRLLKQDPETQGIPVVILTAHAMKGDERAALEAGAVGYLAKPINTRTFPASLATILARADTKVAR